MTTPLLHVRCDASHFWFETPPGAQLDLGSKYYANQTKRETVAAVLAGR